MEFIKVFQFIKGNKPEKTLTYINLSCYTVEGYGPWSSSAWVWTHDLFIRSPISSTLCHHCPEQQSMGLRHAVSRHPIMRCIGYWGGIYMVHVTGSILLEWSTSDSQGYLITNTSDSPVYFEGHSISYKWTWTLLYTRWLDPGALRSEILKKYIVWHDSGERLLNTRVWFHGSWFMVSVSDIQVASCSH